jgi:uncharacterized protein YggE
MNNKIWLMAVGIGLALILSIGGIVLAQDTGNTDTQNPGAVSVNVQSQQTGIWVNGVGEVTATPDMAILTLGVEAQATTVTEAQSQASAAMEKVMAALKNNGIAEKDIQTQYYNISKVSHWDEKGSIETIDGYRVSNTVTVKIRNISKAGEIIDAAAVAGGDSTRINGISFTLDDAAAATQQAREKAMTDAKVKAQQLATLSEVKLGKVTYISESSYVPYSSRSAVPMADSASGAKTVISPGELEITVNVQVAYAIAE